MAKSAKNTKRGAVGKKNCASCAYKHHAKSDTSTTTSQGSDGVSVLEGGQLCWNFALGFTTEVREAILRAQHGYCAAKGCVNKATEVHHRVPNTATNRKLFSLFLNSPFNGVGLCRGCHANRKEEFNVTEDMAMAYESWLKNFGYGKLFTTSNNTYASFTKYFRTSTDCVGEA